VDHAARDGSHVLTSITVTAHLCRDRRPSGPASPPEGHNAIGLAFPKGCAKLTRHQQPSKHAPICLTIAALPNPDCRSARALVFLSDDGKGREFLRRATQVKNIWVPYGE